MDTDRSCGTNDLVKDLKLLDRSCCVRPQRMRENASQRLSIMRREVQSSPELAALSSELLHALGDGDIDQIRSVLSRMNDQDMRAVLTTPSNDAKLGLQTPFMRAASRYVN